MDDFTDLDYALSFPAPIAQALVLMMSEIEESGEETTPDETAAVIEAVFTYLGRLWVAEYLEAVQSDPERADDQINQDLASRLTSNRSPLTGQWVGLARRIRDRLRGHKTIVDDLQAIDFGRMGEDDHPVARLMNFRNHFSHGSFVATIAEIRTHRRLLYALLARVPALRHQVPIAKQSETGRTVRANGRWDDDSSVESADLADGQPVILGDEGQRLELYPLLHLGYGNGQLALSSPNADHPPSRLLEHPALTLWLERYTAERAGLIEFQPPRQEPEPDSESHTQLRAALGSGKSLILVEGHPGCGASHLIEGLTDRDPRALGLDRFAAIQRVRIVPATPSQSGLTIGCMVLRLIERALDEGPRSRQADLQNLLKTQLPEALSALKDSGKRVLLGIDQLHEGASVYRGEPLSVIQVYEALAESSVTVVATTITGCLDKPIYDHHLPIAVAQAPSEELVRHWSQRLAPPGSLHERVLHALSAAPEAVPMFALCDALEAGDQPRVFEPAVERALWDLRPLLEWRREERTVDGNAERLRLWRLFSPTLHSILTEPNP